ncbi:sulfite oxidase [Tundrisphaera lichenicola]|uniref:sulfite oxidase n=1 Tax=Tundrisphaera lichenicola TaxID=2029860 RepID=UPI003EB82527
MSRTSRRLILRQALTGFTLPWFGGLAARFAGGADGPGPGLVVRSSRPLDAETPPEALDQLLTPNELFFVRSHFGPPAVGLSPWRLEVEGLVEHPLNLSLDELEGMPKVTLPALLQCSGNGRGNYTPTVPGVGWGRGAVGNAEWSGVRLVDVLEKAGIKPDAAHVQLHGSDTPPNPKTPAYFRSIPLSRALDPGTILATTMNGEPLPLLHGGPIRLVVPGWGGNHWIKWLRKLTVSTDESPSFYQQTGYKIPRVPTPPGVNPKPSDLVPVTTLNVKSLIARPLEGAVLPAGKVEIKGVAWTGEGTIKKVEVATAPGAPWSEAKLLGEAHPGSWQQWTQTWDAQPGRYVLQARATDSTGETQPEVTPWNKSGYLWNGIDRVTIEVRSKEGNS